MTLNVPQMNDAISCQMVTEYTTRISPNQWEKVLKRLTQATQSNDVISWQRMPEKLVQNSQEN